MTKHILVVEDNPELAKMWTYLLQRHGYSCDTVHNSTQALQAFEQFPAAMVLVDYYLPDARGTDLLQRIHTLPNISRPISILLTSNPYFKPEGYSDLVDAFVLKPAYPQEIMRLVQSYLPPVAS
jgi:CheY-like chemotaxis protein